MDNQLEDLDCQRPGPTVHAHHEVENRSSPHLQPLQPKHECPHPDHHRHLSMKHLCNFLADSDDEVPTNVIDTCRDHGCQNGCVLQCRYGLALVSEVAPDIVGHLPNLSVLIFSDQNSVIELDLAAHPEWHLHLLPRDLPGGLEKVQAKPVVLLSVSVTNEIFFFVHCDHLSSENAPQDDRIFSSVFQEVLIMLSELSDSFFYSQSGCCSRSRAVQADHFESARHVSGQAACIFGLSHQVKRICQQIQDPHQLTCRFS